MPRLARPAPGHPAKPHATYETDQRARAFWQVSYRCGRDYITAQDANGEPILVEHEREEPASYARRLRLTKPRGFVGPILRRYNDLVFRKPPTRDLAALPDVASALVEDATGEGEPLDAFMKRALMRAQIDREGWVLLDTFGAESMTDAPMTQAQAQQAGARPVLRLIPATHVPNWAEHPGDGGACTVAEVWALLTDREGRAVLRMFDAREYVDAILDENELARGSYHVLEYGEPVAHGYDGVPIVRLRPHFDPLGEVGGSAGDSQAGPLAESQQAIVNLISLTREEVTNVTFSQMIVFGVSDTMVKDVRVGNNRVICVPNPSGSVQMIGADPAQADSIRAEVQDETSNLFRLAGVNAADASTAPQSGLALAFRHNDLATIVAALAIACEDAEAAMWALLAWAWAFEPPARTVYQGKDTELPDFQAEAAGMASIVANTALPPIIRRKVADRFASRNLALDAEEREELGRQIDAAGALSRASILPPARTRPPGDDDATDDDATDDDAEGDE